MKQKNNILKIPRIFFLVISTVWILTVLFKFYEYHKINLSISYLFKLYGNFQFISFLKLMIEYMSAIILVCGIVIGSFYVGKRIIDLMRIKTDSLEENLFFSISTGLGILGYFTFLLGFLGLLYKSIFYLMWIILTLLGTKEIFPTLKNYHKNSKSHKLTYKIFFYFLAIGILFNFIMSFTPEVFYDSLNYHVGLPNYYKLYNKIIPLPYKTPSHFSHLMSIIFLMGMMLKSDITPKLINFSCGLLTVLGIVYFCKKHFKHKLMGIISACAYLFIPIVIYRLWTASSDIGLVLFSFAGVAALINGLLSKNERWLIVSAIFAGFSMGAKYSGIIFTLGLITVILFLKNISFRQKIKKAFLLGSISLIIFSPWLIKNYVEAGNPLHPFFRKYFKIKYPHQLNKLVQNAGRPSKKVNLKDSFLIPWELGTRGGGSKQYSSPDYYMIGAVFLSFIPLLFFIKLDKNNIIYYLLVYFLITYTLWFFWVQRPPKIKYYAPGFPVLSVLAGYIIIKMREINKNLGNFSLIAFFVFISINFFYMIPLAHSIYRPFSLLTGSISKDEYLSSSKPTYPYPSYGVYNYLNKNLPKNSKVLIFGDAKCFHIRRKFIAFDTGNLNPLIEYLKLSKNREEFYNLMREKEITHIVVNTGEGMRTGRFYFSRKDFEILDFFWKKYIREIYNFNGVYLYEILSREEAQKPHKIPPNTVKETYTGHKLRKATTFIKSKSWENGLKELKDLLNRNIDNHEIHYLTGVCYYYTGKYPEARKHAETAYNLNPQDRYKKFLVLLLKEMK